MLVTLEHLVNLSYWTFHCRLSFRVSLCHITSFESDSQKSITVDDTKTCSYTNINQNDKSWWEGTDNSEQRRPSARRVREGWTSSESVRGWRSSWGHLGDGGYVIELEGLSRWSLRLFLWVCENLALFCRALILNSDSKFGCTVDVTLTSSSS